MDAIYLKSITVQLRNFYGILQSSSYWFPLAAVAWTRTKQQPKNSRITFRQRSPDLPEICRNTFWVFVLIVQYEPQPRQNMNTCKLLLLSVAASASLAAIAQDVGRVISSQPIIQQVAAPR